MFARRELACDFCLVSWHSFSACRFCLLVAISLLRVVLLSDEAH